MTLSIPSNISKGTFFTDGLRAGPSYSSLSTTSTDAFGNLILQDYNDFGPGILYSPQNTWNIVPYNTSNGNNIVNPIQLTAPGYLTFTQDNAATTIVQGQVDNQITAANSGRFVQFDWPRVPSIYVSVGNLTNPVDVTFFGTDWYGFPLQMTYTIQNQGTYPADLGTPAKAFYTITGIYVNGIVDDGGGQTISVNASNTFGLPYCTKEWSDVMNFSWAGSNMAVQSGVVVLEPNGTFRVDTPAVKADSQIFLNGAGLGSTGVLISDTIVPGESFHIVSQNGAADAGTVVYWMIPNGGQNLFAPADTTFPATATTGDTRGLFVLPENNTTWAPVPNGILRAVFTIYSMGSDQFQNQLAAGDQPQGAGAVPPKTNTVPRLTVSDLYGVQQFYTGVHA